MLPDLRSTKTKKKNDEHKLGGQARGKAIIRGLLCVLRKRG